MIKHLGAANIGPVENLSVDFGQRLNLITGDTGLGKSFVLDLAWWAMTGTWPKDVNSKVSSGMRRGPTDREIGADVRFSFWGHNNENVYSSRFVRKEQKWVSKGSRPANPGIILYAMADGGFAIWDPHVNYFVGLNIPKVPPCVLSHTEVFDGSTICEGLIRDWGGWQKCREKTYSQLAEVLRVLSGSRERSLVPSSLTRISIDDARDIPTIGMPSKNNLPVVYASFGVKKILSLAYLLIWAWERHLHCINTIGIGIANKITFIIDGIDDHIDPKWQREILISLLSIMRCVNRFVHTQVIATSNSPLPLFSMAPIFDGQEDSWHDLKVDSYKIVLEKKELS